MNYILLTYAIYLPVTVILTVWVARTLFKNGRRFLIDIYNGDEELADSVNKLLIVGFYLINIGYAVMAMKVWGEMEGYREVMESLSRKVGTIILILGGMHFFNLFVLFSMRKRAKREPSIKTKVFNPPPVQ